MKGLPDVHLWDCVLQLLAPANFAAAGDWIFDSDLLNHHSLVDFVPPCILRPSFERRCSTLFEDNEPVLRMIIKGRPQLRHVARKHRINFAWLHE